MALRTKAAIRTWMRKNIEYYRDPKTNEVNMTALVEGWDCACSNGGETLDSNHLAWEVATEFVR